ncbi:MAG: DUF3606 domain-containing protein [Xanthomonas sp.]
MSDDPRNTGSPDRDRSDLHADDEMRYWTQAPVVSADGLHTAVQAMGSSTVAPSAHLRT